MIHLKSLPRKEFSWVVDGRQEYLFVHDKAIKEGEYIAINEIDESTRLCQPTGRCCLVYVDGITEKHAGLAKGYRAVSIKPCNIEQLTRFHSKDKFSFNLNIGVPVIPAAEIRPITEEATQ